MLLKYAWLKYIWFSGLIASGADFQIKEHTGHGDRANLEHPVEAGRNILRGMGCVL